MSPPDASGTSTEHWWLRFDFFRNFGSVSLTSKPYDKCEGWGAKRNHRRPMMRLCSPNAVSPTRHLNIPKKRSFSIGYPRTILAAKQPCPAKRACKLWISGTESSRRIVSIALIGSARVASTISLEALYPRSAKVLVKYPRGNPFKIGRGGGSRRADMKIGPISA
jgi:hypothetical protein